MHPLIHVNYIHKACVQSTDYTMGIVADRAGIVATTQAEPVKLGWNQSSAT